MVFALHAGLGVLLEEGLEHAWARHLACGQALQGGLEKLGLVWNVKVPDSAQLERRRVQAA